MSDALDWRARGRAVRIWRVLFASAASAACLAALPLAGLCLSYIFFSMFRTRAEFDALFQNALTISGEAEVGWVIVGFLSPLCISGAAMLSLLAVADWKGWLLPEDRRSSSRIMRGATDVVLQSMRDMGKGSLQALVGYSMDALFILAAGLCALVVWGSFVTASKDWPMITLMATLVPCFLSLVIYRIRLRFSRHHWLRVGS